jgi:hypothetical protein
VRYTIGAMPLGILHVKVHCLNRYLTGIRTVVNGAVAINVAVVNGRAQGVEADGGWW